MKTEMKKNLYRSDENIIVSGVLGGIGERYDLDPVVVRLVFIVLWVITGFVPGILAYIVGLLVIPEKPTMIHMDAEVVE